MVKRRREQSQIPQRRGEEGEERETGKVAGGEALSESHAVWIPLTAQTQLFIRSGRLFDPAMRGFPKHEALVIMITPEPLSQHEQRWGGGRLRQSGGNTIIGS